MALEVTINLTHDEDGQGWVANVTQMPGCISFGDDLIDALNMIGDAMYGWSELSVQDGTADPLTIAIDDESTRLAAEPVNWKGGIEGEMRKEAMINQAKLPDRLKQKTLADLSVEGEQEEI